MVILPCIFAYLKLTQINELLVDIFDNSNTTFYEQEKELKLLK